MADDFRAKYDELKGIIKGLGTAFRYANLQIDLRSLYSVNLAYSSSGEDLWLRQFMKSVLRSGQPGFYVDLGCNEPIITSNTYLFYSYGWRGICIDVSPQFADDFKALRPRDVVVHAAISDQNRPLYFATQRAVAGHKTGRVTSSPDDFDLTYFPSIEVKSRTLADVLRAHVPAGQVIDFMSIDLEDSELPALRSNDWAAYKPRVILIECGTGFDPLAPLNFPTIKFLADLGYKYEGYSCNNVLLTGPNFASP
ncbi:MAG: FkbM family methyltransferase [Rhodospirillaceae bacterium]|nr:FkbM family methyltransferase [Rhodospirillaceae bacterium]